MKKRWILLVLAPLLLMALIWNIKISRLEISGNSLYTNEEIEQLVFPTKMSRNTLFCFINTMRGKKESIPFVQDYSVSLLNPFKAEVIIYEKSIIGYVPYLGSNMYFDKDGVVVESSEKLLKRIPMVQGLSFKSVVLYKQLPVSEEKVFSYILKLTQLISTYGLEVDLIKLNTQRDTVLMIGEIEVVLGDSNHTDAKVAELHDILPNIEGMRGTLYLDSYTALDGNKMYTFKKK